MEWTQNNTQWVWTGYHEISRFVFPQPEIFSVQTEQWSRLFAFAGVAVVKKYTTSTQSNRIRS